MALARSHSSNVESGLRRIVKTSRSPRNRRGIENENSRRLILFGVSGSFIPNNDLLRLSIVGLHVWDWRFPEFFYSENSGWQHQVARARIWPRHGSSSRPPANNVRSHCPTAAPPASSSGAHHDRRNERPDHHHGQHHHTIGDDLLNHSTGHHRTPHGRHLAVATHDPAQRAFRLQSGDAGAGGAAVATHVPAQRAFRPHLVSSQNDNLPVATHVPAQRAFIPQRYVPTSPLTTRQSSRFDAAHLHSIQPASSAVERTDSRRWCCTERGQVDSPSIATHRRIT